METTEIAQDKRELDLCDKLSKRQKKLEKDREMTDALWDDIEDIVFPRRGVYSVRNRKKKGERLGAKIFDGTSAAAGQDLADGFQGYSASSAITWWAAKLRSKEAMKDRNAKEWLSDIVEAQSNEMAQSNFYEQLNIVVTDAVFYGPGTMASPRWDANSGRLVYQAMHPREIYFARDYMGRINLWHRVFPISGRQIADEFPNKVLPQKLKKAIEDDPFKEFMCTHAISLRTERDTNKLNAVNKRIASVYYLESEKVILSESGYDDWPLLTWSWRVNSTETYPRSPAIDSLYDIMTTNSAAKAVLQSAQLAIMPPLIADESLKDRIKLTPFGITWTEGSQQTAKRLIDAQSNYPIGVDQVAKLKADLRERFKANTFTLLSAMTQQMTAYQASEIQGEKAALLGPLITRNQSELLGPVINATFKLLMQNKRLPAPPQSIMQYMNTPVDLEFLGPVALANRRYLQLQGLTPALNQVMALIEKNIFPEMRDKFGNGDELLDYIWDSNGAPIQVIAKPETVQMIRDTRMKQQQEEMQLGMQQMKADQGLTKAKAAAT
jgi:hypothetical protein